MLRRDTIAGLLLLAFLVHMIWDYGVLGAIWVAVNSMVPFGVLNILRPKLPFKGIR